MHHKKYNYIVGVDEVGRGPLAGPVMVAAFLCSIENESYVLERLKGITDSKKLSEKKRNEYAKTMHQLKEENKIDIAMETVSADIIDSHGIIFAINSALFSSIDKLSLDSEKTLIYLDGGLSAPNQYDQQTIIQGDSKIWQIAAASVIAKVSRDAIMVDYAKKYPEYGFEKNKGYGTQFHRDMIVKHSTCDIHRKTWIK